MKQTNLDLTAHGISKCSFIKDRRNGSSVYQAIFQNEPVILKIGPAKDLREEDRLRELLNGEGLNVAKTLKTISLTDNELLLIEEYLCAPVLIEALIPKGHGPEIPNNILEKMITYVRGISYSHLTKSPIDPDLDPFYHIDDLKELGELGNKVIEVFNKLVDRFKLNERMVLSHGDLTLFNLTKDLHLIDFEDVGLYPVGLDAITLLKGHLWFPAKELHLLGPHRLYQYHQQQTEVVNHQLISHLTKRIPQEEIDIYLKGLFLLRGIWHLLGAGDAPEFKKWRVDKIINLSQEIM